MRAGLIVGYRGLVSDAGRVVELATPIHVRDLVRLTLSTSDNNRGADSSDELMVCIKPEHTSRARSIERSLRRSLQYDKVNPSLYSIYRKVCFFGDESNGFVAVMNLLVYQKL